MPSAHVHLRSMTDASHTAVCPQKGATLQGWAPLVLSIAPHLPDMCVGPRSPACLSPGWQWIKPTRGPAAHACPNIMQGARWLGSMQAMRTFVHTRYFACLFTVCDRHSGHHMAQQMGRPLDLSTYRSAAVMQGAAQLGWTQEYMQNEDLEAERLFDYGLLAPEVLGALRSCRRQDLRQP